MAEQIVPEVSEQITPGPGDGQNVESCVQSPEASSVKTSNQIRIIKRLPLVNNDAMVELHPDDLIIGKTSIDIIDSLSHFNGIHLRIPSYYVVNSVTKAQASVTPHVRAIAVLISSVLARRMMSSNIVLQVSHSSFFFSYA